MLAKCSISESCNERQGPARFAKFAKIFELQRAWLEKVFDYKLLTHLGREKIWGTIQWNNGTDAREVSGKKEA